MRGEETDRQTDRHRDGDRERERESQTEKSRVTHDRIGITAHSFKHIHGSFHGNWAIWCPGSFI